MSRFFLDTHPEVKIAIRIVLNVATFVLTAGIFHLAYYAFMIINAFSGHAIIKHPLAWEPFGNIPALQLQPILLRY